MNSEGTVRYGGLTRWGMRYGAQRWRGMGSRRKLCAHSSQKADETAMALLGTPDATRRSGFVSTGHGLDIEHRELAMRMHVRMFGMVLCALAAAACGGDEGSGPAGTGGTAGSGGNAGDQTSTVNGRVVEDQQFIAIAGATVTVDGTLITATTNEAGQFTLVNVPNGDRFFITAVADHWGTVDYYEVPAETGGAIELLVVADGSMDAFAAEIPRTLDSSKGIVDITYFGAQGGETGTIDASSDPAVTFGADDLPVVQDTVLLDSDGFADLIFTSVDPAEGRVSATATGASGVTVCGIDQSALTTYPIIAKSITWVYAECMAQ